MNESIFILKGNIVYSRSAEELEICEHGYLVCENGRVKGVYQTLPFVYGGIPITDYGDRLIIPGLVDLHVHAPQYSFRGLGMDMELLEWLETNTFPEEAKFQETEYAKKAYRIFADQYEQKRYHQGMYLCHRAQRGNPSSYGYAGGRLGLNTMVGKVNMDRNCPDYLREESAEASAAETWSGSRMCCTENIRQYKADPDAPVYAELYG